MNTQELFQTAVNTVKQTESNVMSGIDARLLHAILGMGDESGELVKQAKDQVFHGKTFTYNERIEELGDFFYFFTQAILALAELDGEKSPTRIFEDVILANKAKLITARYVGGYTHGKFAKRDIVAEYQTIAEVTGRE